MNRYTSVFEQSLMLVPDGEYVLYKDAQQAIATARAEVLRKAAENEQKEKAIAFVKGAKWWEYHSTKGTMWQSDQELAAIEAEKRFGYKPTLDDLFPKETMARIISILANKQEGNNV